MSEKQSGISRTSFAHERRHDLPGSSISETAASKEAFARAQAGPAASPTIPEERPSAVAPPPPAHTLPDPHPSFAAPARHELDAQPTSSAPPPDKLKEQFIKVRQQQARAGSRRRRAR